MNPTAILTVSVLLASAAATGVTFALRQNDPAPAQASAAELQRTLAELQKDHAALRAKFEALASTPQPMAAPGAVERSAVPTLSAELIGPAVEAYLQKRERAGSAGAVEAAGAAGAAAFDVDADFATLAKTFFVDPAGWQRAFAAGKMDEVLKKFEAIAAASPKDAKAQMDLANAYLSFLQLSPNKGPLAEKSDQALDKVLAIDDSHWEARFTKAISYSFYPEFTGKPKEAVAQFERLVAQQEGMAPQPQEAQTYLMLGNLLERRDPAKAKEIWAKGARRHPENAELVKKAGG